MDIINKIEELFIDHNWSILVDVEDEPIEGKIEKYDVSGLTFTDSYEINCLFLKTENLVVQKIFKMDNTPFSNLRIYTDDPYQSMERLIKESKEITRETFSDFVKNLTTYNKEVVFNNNGTWVKVNSKK